MGTPIYIVLIALVLFQIKHYLCDFVLQTQSQVMAKGHPMALLAVCAMRGLHAVGSIPAPYMPTSLRSLLVILALIAFEFVLHYHVDFTKARVDATRRMDGRRSAILDRVRAGPVHPSALTYLAFPYVTTLL